MIEIELEFDAAIHQVVEILLSLPEPMRPLQYSDAEAPPRGRRPIGGHEAFLKKTRRRKGGFCLYNDRVEYSLRAAADGLICDAWADVDPSIIEASFAGPFLASCRFGYACLREERHARNRVVVQRGINSIEAWVGRDTRKSIPGLYWLTLLCKELIELHSVDVDKVAMEATETWMISDRCLVFKMGSAPQHWPDRSGNGGLVGEPWLFDVAKVKPDIEAMPDLMSVLDALRRWQ